MASSARSRAASPLSRPDAVERERKQPRQWRQERRKTCATCNPLVVGQKKETAIAFAPQAAPRLSTLGQPCTFLSPRLIPHAIPHPAVRRRAAIARARPDSLSPASL